MEILILMLQQKQKLNILFQHPNLLTRSIKGLTIEDL